MSRGRTPDYGGYDHLPGNDRERPRFGSDPTIAREALISWANPQRAFAFQSWAMANHFIYPAESLGFFCQCGSAAEAFFVRPFVLRVGVSFESAPDGTPPWVASVGELRVSLQVPCALYRLDVVVQRAAFRLAVEVDGLTYHRQTAEQIAADYIRQRRIVVSGYTVARFTAQEAFSDPDECWRQIDLIVAAHTSQAAVNPAQTSAKVRSKLAPAPAQSAVNRPKNAPTNPAQTSPTDRDFSRPEAPI